MQKQLLFVFIAVGLLNSANAQLSVLAEANDTAFIYSLAGPGVVVSNIVRTCGVDGSGVYNSSSANVGIENGIVLTSGAASNTIGPNNSSGITGYASTLGDVDLDALIPGYFTYDACIIEFDMTVMSDTVSLNYVFGSEEYLEFVGTSFNDVFAFWVSGPGIDEPINIATIPGSGDVVAINTVNELSNPDYYVDNGDGYTDPYLSDSSYIQYDGLTVVLNASIPVIAGETYHMKIAVADAGDGILDSGVFLETGSLGSLRMGATTSSDGESDWAIENCVNGYITFTRYVVGDFDLVIDYHIGGTALNGIDYALIEDQATILAGEASVSIPIIAIVDGADEGAEFVELYLYNPQSEFVYDTVSIQLDDVLKSNFTFSNLLSTYSFTNTTEFIGTDSWNFGDGSAISTELNPTHVYAEAGNYEVCLTRTDLNGCAIITCKTISIGTAIMDQQLQQLIGIYPNPTTQFLTIELPQQLAKETTLTVKNVLGEIKVFMAIENQFTTLDVAQYTKGIYVVELKTMQGNVSKVFNVQ